MHAFGAAAPVEHAEPAGHIVHSAALVRLVAFEKVPALHGRAVDAPTGQKCPLKQIWHAVLLVLEVNVPPSHGWHDA